MDSEPFQNFIPLLNIITSLSQGSRLGLFGIMILLFSSAILSGLQITFFYIRPELKDQLEKSKISGTKVLLKLLSKPEKLFATIKISTILVNIGIVFLSVYVMTTTFDIPEEFTTFGILIEIILVTFLLLLFGEMIPKIIARRLKDQFLQFSSYPLYVSFKLFSPISNLLVGSTFFVNKKLKKKHGDSVTKLSEALESPESETEQDTEILSRIVTFGSIDVKEIMKPRVDVVTAEIGYSFEKIKSLIIESGYSRIPIYEEIDDNIKGILLIKDLLEYIDIEDYEWQKCIMAPLYVPETMKINDLLEEFREKKNHIAIVIDEYGGFMGIITLEDIIEEIVGEISDENDDENQQFIKIDENNYIWDGKLQINEFYKTLNIREDIFSEYRGETDSIAGLLLEVRGEIPKKGETIVISDYTFLILESDNRKIIKIKSTYNEGK